MLIAQQVNATLELKGNTRYMELELELKGKNIYALQVNTGAER
jgi:hypothetical protein